MPPVASQAPAAHLLLHPREQAGVILLEELVELGRGVHEAVLGILAHQVQRGGEGAGALLARVAQPPQPGHVDVGVAEGDDAGLERLQPAPAAHLLVQAIGGGAQRGVEGVGAGPREVNLVRGLVERLHQLHPAQVVVVQRAGGQQQRVQQVRQAVRVQVDPD